MKLAAEARELMSKQRPSEALAKLDEAEKFAPSSAVVWNMRGSVYTAAPMRDFAKARECFEKAEKITPESFEPKFNLAELLYVQQKYDEAEKALSKIAETFIKLREDVRHLVQFKILVCQLKLGKLEEAEKTRKTFTFMDDTPAYYFATAAFCFHRNDLAEARVWIGKAERLFKLPANAVYLDSLMEARWLPQISVPEQGK